MEAFQYRYRLTMQNTLRKQTIAAAHSFLELGAQPTAYPVRDSFRIELERPLIRGASTGKRPVSQRSVAQVAIEVSIIFHQWNHPEPSPDESRPPLHPAIPAPSSHAPGSCSTSPDLAR